MKLLISENKLRAFIKKALLINEAMAKDWDEYIKRTRGGAAVKAAWVSQSQKTGQAADFNAFVSWWRGQNFTKSTGDPGSVINLLSSTAPAAPTAPTAPVNTAAAALIFPSATKSEVESSAALGISQEVENLTANIQTGPLKDDSSAHDELEKTASSEYPGAIRKNNDVYSATIAKYPLVKAELDAMFNLYDRAKQQRLDYLNADFTERYRKLIAHVYKTAGNQGKADLAQLDVDMIKNALISRIETSELIILQYPEEPRATLIKKHSSSFTGLLVGFIFDPSEFGPWADEVKDMGRPPLAFAPYSTSSNVCGPPILVFSNIGKLIGVKNNFGSEADMLSTWVHELIHQEDHAMSFLMSGGNRITDEDNTVLSYKTDDLATKLLSAALYPADKLDIRAQIRSYPTIYDAVDRWISNSLNDNELFAFSKIENILFIIRFYYGIKAGKELTKEELQGTPHYVSLIGDKAEKKGLNVAIDKIFSNANNNEMLKQTLLPSHIRTALLQNFPAIEKKIKNKTDYSSIVKAAIDEAKGIEFDTFLISLILLVTDPSKLASLTFVASREEKTSASYA